MTPPPTSGNIAAVTLTPTELARYSRHLSLKEFGVAGQEALRAARVLVIGAGGLGSPALLYLAAAGVGTLGIVDHDCVDLSNLQRQVLFTESSVGESKAEQAGMRLLALNPHLQVVTISERLTADNALALFREWDVVLDGTDHFGTRYVINDACVLLGKPLISAAIHRFEGQAFTYVPKRGGCYRCLFPEPPAVGAVPNCAEAGVLGVLPGVMGTLQATEAIKLITGLGEPLINRLLTYDALELRFGEFGFSRRTDCAICGDHPTLTTLQSIEVSCVVPTAPSITAQELQAALQQHDAPLLVDVREPHEFAAGHLANSINAPLATLAAKLPDLPQTNVVFICRSGARSQQACLTAGNARIEAKNLQGGLLAWQREMDASLPVV